MCPDNLIWYQTSSDLNVYIFVYSTIDDTVPVTLTDSSKDRSGKLQVFYHSHWGYVCDQGWDLAESQVICRQLGYTNGARDLNGLDIDVVFSQGRYIMGDVRCEGHEQELGECYYSTAPAIDGEESEVQPPMCWGEEVYVSCNPGKCANSKLPVF